MKTLFILRHAKSSWKDNNLADHDRPLNKRGKSDAPRMGELMRREEFLPELILTSSALRARKTAELLLEASGCDAELVVSPDLYAHYPEAYLEMLANVDDRYAVVMIVGHNPGLEELLEILTGQWERMPTAALAKIRLPINSWNELDEDIEGELVEIWLPRDLNY
jgi:phosphohistidine phosphatase